MVRIVAIFVFAFVMWAFATIPALKIEAAIAAFYPTMTLIPYCGILIAAVLVWMIAFMRNLLMISIITGLVVQSLGCLLALRHGYGFDVPYWAGWVFWIAPSFFNSVNIVDTQQVSRLVARI